MRKKVHKGKTGGIFDGIKNIYKNLKRCLGALFTCRPRSTEPTDETPVRKVRLEPIIPESKEIKAVEPINAQSTPDKDEFYPELTKYRENLSGLIQEKNWGTPWGALFTYRHRSTKLKLVNNLLIVSPVKEVKFSKNQILASRNGKLGNLISKFGTHPSVKALKDAESNLPQTNIFGL